MDLGKALSLYEEGARWAKKAREAVHSDDGLVAINPEYGYIQITVEAMKDIVKDSRDIKVSKIGDDAMFPFEFETIVNGIQFISVSEKEEVW